MKHDSLQPIFNMRLAGWRGDKQIPLEKEIETYMKLESPFVDWRDRLEEGANSPSEQEANQAIQDGARFFREKGGHISRMQPEAIQYVMEHGSVIFLELEVRNNIYATFGSVSALSAAPASVNAGRTDIEDALLTSATPNLEITDVGCPEIIKKDLIHNAKETLYICRSSIADALQKDHLDEESMEMLPDEMIGLSLRRQGFASLGKLGTFAAAQQRGATKVMMNIGFLQTYDNLDIAMDDYRTNQPSRKHNDWLTNWGWRLNYSNTIVPDKAVMYWQAYQASLEEGIQACRKRLVKWDANTLHVLNNQISASLEQDITSGRHKPWGEL